jgi:hypothetical protein
LEEEIRLPFSELLCHNFPKKPYNMPQMRKRPALKRASPRRATASGDRIPDFRLFSWIGMNQVLVERRKKIDKLYSGLNKPGTDPIASND